jgi:hypothetical protein
MALTCDKKNLIVGTENGLIIRYDIFAVKELY